MAIFLFLLAPFLLLAAPLKVDVSARSAILMNCDTGAILFDKESRIPAHPASITKIATALYTLEKKKGRLDEAAIATRNEIMKIPAHIRQANLSDHPHYRLESDGHHIGIRAGESYPLHVLLHGLLIASGNDAANILAKHVSGDIDLFMAGLNEWLAEKGIKETHFLNPSGLYHPGHQTTAYDMALITREGLKVPQFREIIKKDRYTWPSNGGRPQQVLMQTNKLLKPGPYYYSKAIGVKTGHTAAAGYTLVAAAEHEGRTLIAVLLGCPDINARFKDAIKLFEAAFAEKSITRTLFSQAYDKFSCELKGAKNLLEAHLKDDLKLCYFPAEEIKVEAKIRWNVLRLPIEQGEEVGKLELIDTSGLVYQEKPLFAVKRVDKTTLKAFSDLCIYYRTALILIFLSLNLGAALLYFLKKPKKIV